MMIMNKQNKQLEDFIKNIKKSNGVNILTSIFVVNVNVVLADKTTRFACPVRIKIRNNKRTITELINYINVNDLINKKDIKEVNKIFADRLDSKLRDLLKNNRDEFDKMMNKVDHDFFFINSQGQYKPRIEIYN